MAVKCPKCQTENPETSLFCSDCGTKLDAAGEFSLFQTETLETSLKELSTGSTFANRYQIIEELGKGGMGKVYKVLDTHINEKVALKLLKPEIAADRKTIERFSNELKFARKISHRNVCRMYDLGREAGGYFITMEYVSGEDLKSFIRRSRQLVVGTATLIAKQVCEGLAEAHRVGVIHRDIKPSNIMIDRDGNARIMDFGIARSAKGEALTGDNVMIGTPDYMSPEQAAGTGIDQRSDIYSLGVVIFEMLTGERPFKGDTSLSVAMKHKSEAPPNPKDLNDQIPDDLSCLVLMCLEKKKEKRYQSAEELLAALDDITEKKHPLTGKDEKKKSVAVLPFANMSADPEQEYFCDGISEEIINALTQIQDLRVVARTSAFAFKGKDVDIREIGKILNVDKIVEGSVRKVGDRLRVTAQLINVSDGYHLWSARFDRRMADIFDIQDEISFAIVNNLKIKLLSKEKAAILKQPTGDLDAYNIYLKGRYFMNKYTDSGLKEAIGDFEEAIEKDPNFALPYAMIAISYLLLCMDFAVDLPADAMERAKHAAKKSAELDPYLAEAHTALAIIASWYDWDRRTAGNAFRRALDLNPNSTLAHTWNALYLSNLEHKYNEAIEELKLVIDLDPLDLMARCWLGAVYLLGTRDLDQAVKEFKAVIAIEPDFGMGHHCLSDAYREKGLFEESIAEMMEANRLIGRASGNLECLGLTYAKAGLREKATEILEELKERSRQTPGLGHAVAWVYCGLGQKDEMFAWLGKAFKEREVGLTWWLTMPEWNSLLRYPEFIVLLEKMRLGHLANLGK